MRNIIILLYFVLLSCPLAIATTTTTLTDTNTIDFTDSGTTETADVKTGSIGPTQIQSTTVTAGTYNSGDFTVDADGRITNAVQGQLTSLSDIGTSTKTAGNVLIADGTKFQSVAMSGNCTITSAGVTSCSNTSRFSTDSSTTGHVTYVGCSDSISTAITNATSGDVLVLGDCTYTVTSAITISKAIKLIGQGPTHTIISTTTADSGLLSITSDNVTIQNIGFTLNETPTTPVAGITFDCSGGTVCSNEKLSNFVVTFTSSVHGGTSILFEDAGGLIENGIITQSTPSMTGTEQSKMIYSLCHTGTCEATTTIDINNVFGKNTGDGTSNTLLRGFMNYTDFSAAFSKTMNIRNCVIIVNPTTATGLTNGIEVENSNNIINIYNSFVDGGNQAEGVINVDARVDTGTTLNVYNTVFANNDVMLNGTINRYGHIEASGISGTALTQKASISTTPGLNANSAISLTGQKGGNTTITTTGTGGIGGGTSITAGQGGSADSANTASTGGKGGGYSYTTGAGGTATVASGTNTGGDAGDYEVIGGAGGQSSTGTSGSGGNGGYIYMTGGTAGTGITATGNIGNIVVGRTSGGTIRGALCVKCVNPDSGDDIGIDGAQISTTQRVMGVTRETNTANNGHDFIIHGGGAASGATNKGGGKLVLESGLNTGTGSSVIRMKTASDTGSGTTDGSYVTRNAIGRANITNAVSKTLAVITNTNNFAGGGTIFYTVVADDGTDYQSLSGMAVYGWADKAGVTQKSINDLASAQVTEATNGTLTCSWSIASGFNINTTCTSSLTPTTMRIYFEIMNHSNNDYTAASVF